MRITEIPDDLLAKVFSFLDATNCLRIRGVCKAWRRSGGCGCVHVLMKPELFPTYIIPLVIPFRAFKMVCAISFVGHQKNNEPRENPRQKKALKPPAKRIRGHLPQPNVIPQGEVTTNMTLSVKELSENLPNDFHDAVVTKRNGFAAKIERDALAHCFQSLDVSVSTFAFGWNCRNPWLPEIHYDSRKLTNALKELDLSGLRHLERLSVRCCKSLEKLLLPPSLIALDASDCSRLLSVSMPVGYSEGGLECLNLKGCRSLKTLFGNSTNQAMRFTRELDISSLLKLPTQVLASALQNTSCLVSVSLRYSATDQLISALAESESARETLRLVDVAFSAQLTDPSIEALVQGAPNLERLNMRGCKSVSAMCYNKVPILLKNRLDGVILQGNASTTANRKRRKGDNLFALCEENERKESASKRRK